MHIIEVQEIQLLSSHIGCREHHSLALRARPLLGIPRPKLPVQLPAVKGSSSLPHTKVSDSPVFFPPRRWVEVTEKSIFASCEEASSLGHNAHTRILFQKPPWMPTHDLTTENPCLRSWAFGSQIWEVLRDTEQLWIILPGAFTWKQIDCA